MGFYAYNGFYLAGNGFGRGYIDLGGLEVRQISSFKKIWEINEGGPGNLGATFFEPTGIPDGYFMLGSYGQQNNRPLFGSVLVGKDKTNNRTGSTEEALRKPIDYVLIWSSQESDHTHGYIWFPVPPDGYEALGHVVTTTPEKPSLDKIRCVRSDLTDDCELENWIWSDEGNRGGNGYGFRAYSLRPDERGTRAQGISIGAFAFVFMKKNTKDDDTQLPISCLKKKNFNSFSMPNSAQIKALIQEYSPRIFLHPMETYLPSSVAWFFANGAKLCRKNSSEPFAIKYSGSNLPVGGLDDETFWLDLPTDKTAKEKLKKGDLPSSEAYIHVKSMFGGTYTDITFWIFYPFNGPATVRIGPFNIHLSGIGQHVGDWEHVTLRISNFNGMLQKVFFSEHSGGTWVDASFLEFSNGSNRVLAYASLNGHAFYSKQGMVSQGFQYLGIRNDMKRSDLVMDTGERYVIIGADHIGHEIVKPPWLNYARQWGPKVTYNLGTIVKIMDSVLVGVYKSAFHNLVSLFPSELLGEEGPTGPKMKRNWKKDEV